jgi:hypothetical protein
LRDGTDVLQLSAAAGQLGAGPKGERPMRASGSGGDVDITAQTCALMPTALSRMRFIAFAHSSAVFVSSNTSVNAGDDSACPRKNPGSSGRPPQGRCSAPCLGPRPCFPLRSCRHFYRPQSSSASRFTAGASEFFILSQSGERPER